MLEGIKVLSFTHFLQGPAAVQMLADTGAEVIKIEPPQGAFERAWAGFDAFTEGVSMFFLLGNRNQRGIQLDLRQPQAREIVYRLVREADVLLENYRPGVMDKLGFGYEALKAINPRLVYCSCTGYGGSGPNLKRPGQDLLLQAMSGMAMLSGDGEAYSYLPASVSSFPSGAAMCRELTAAGLVEVSARPLTHGVATQYEGRRPARAGERTSHDAQGG